MTTSLTKMRAVCAFICFCTLCRQTNAACSSPPICCRAYTVACLSCASCVTPEQYCSGDARHSPVCNAFVKSLGALSSPSSPSPPSSPTRSRSTIPIICNAKFSWSAKTHKWDKPPATAGKQAIRLARKSARKAAKRQFKEMKKLYCP